MDEKIVKLKYSIPILGKDDSTVNVNELRLGRLKAKHLRLLPDDFMEKGGKISAAAMIPLIAGLANIPESAADEIDIEDLTAISEALGDFLSVSPQTGGK